MALETAWETEDMAWVVVSATVSTPDATASFNEVATPPAACSASWTVFETSSVTAPRASLTCCLALSFLGMVRVPRPGGEVAHASRARCCGVPAPDVAKRNVAVKRDGARRSRNRQDRVRGVFRRSRFSCAFPSRPRSKGDIR